MATGRIYREEILQNGTKQLTNLSEVKTGIKEAVLPYSSKVFVGVAVWTDRTSDPLSKYEVEKFEIG